MIKEKIKVLNPSFSFLGLYTECLFLFVFVLFFPKQGTGFFAAKCKEFCVPLFFPFLFFFPFSGSEDKFFTEEKSDGLSDGSFSCYFLLEQKGEKQNK